MAYDDMPPVEEFPREQVSVAVLPELNMIVGFESSGKLVETRVLDDLGGMDLDDLPFGELPELPCGDGQFRLFDDADAIESANLAPMDFDDTEC